MTCDNIFLDNIQVAAEGHLAVIQTVQLLVNEGAITAQLNEFGQGVGFLQRLLYDVCNTDNRQSYN